MNQAIFVLIISIAITIASSAQAVNCIRPVYSDNYRDLIHQAAVIDEDGRRTEEEYAQQRNRPLAEVQNRFAATGVLKCAGMTLSAQLTGTTNVITTAAHGFTDLKTCSKVAAPESCTFTVKIGGVERSSRVTTLVGSGSKCPKRTEWRDDWAVLKIEPPLDGVSPYGLPENSEIKEGQTVVSVSSRAQDFVRPDPVSRVKSRPKSIEECEVKSIVGVTRPVLLESNCDSASGSSGGSLLRSGQGRDTLVGITIGNQETDAQAREAERRGKPNSGPYSLDAWSTYHVPLNHTFLKTVEEAMGGRSI